MYGLDPLALLTRHHESVIFLNISALLWSWLVNQDLQPSLPLEIWSEILQYILEEVRGTKYVSVIQGPTPDPSILVCRGVDLNFTWCLNQREVEAYEGFLRAEKHRGWKKTGKVYKIPRSLIELWEALVGPSRWTSQYPNNLHLLCTGITVPDIISRLNRTRCPLCEYNRTILLGRKGRRGWGFDKVFGGGGRAGLMTLPCPLCLGQTCLATAKLLQRCRWAETQDSALEEEGREIYRVRCRELGLYDFDYFGYLLRGRT
ncbi:hypothetical protein JAAARDRAFT_34353 [Jaapia argillacea MUCL 33604]|uniref:Uncharacterized protein n=1 Tax=Jaapia argillacea MUCL 33604 TaxID=933084 RepID=A0A067PXC7_9AGAM|nr:hypothetical protein JAAARDRAFT_34353 [Jaapia argillacea MUCL 33604]